MGVRILLMVGVVALVALLGSAPALSAADDVAGPDPTVAEWPDWPYRADCGSMSFDPVAVFSGPTNAERGSLPAERALRGMLAREFPFPLPRHHWRLAAEKPGQALFLHGRLDAEFESGSELRSFELRRRRGQWRMRTYSQVCEPFTVKGGRGASGWYLAKNQPPLDPAVTRVRVEIPDTCGSTGNAARAEQPVFHELPGKLVMTIWPRPAAVSPNTVCASASGRAGKTLLVTLPGPLGDRRLYDGSSFPPLPAAPLEGLEPPTFAPVPR